MFISSLLVFTLKVFFPTYLLTSKSLLHWNIKHSYFTFCIEFCCQLFLLVPHSLVYVVFRVSWLFISLGKLLRTETRERAGKYVHLLLTDDRGHYKSWTNTKSSAWGFLWLPDIVNSSCNALESDSGYKFSEDFFPPQFSTRVISWGLRKLVGRLFLVCSPTESSSTLLKVIYY